MKHPQKTKGIGHIGAAFRYSLAGCRRLLKETAHKHQLIASLILIALFFYFNLSLPYFIGLFILILLVFAFEALNTAIEEIVDSISLEWSEAAKHAKDLGSYSVACTMVATGVFALYALIYGS